MDPEISLASSDRISPKVFSVTTTSNWEGSCTSCMEQLSTSILVSFTSGYSLPTSATTFLQSLEVSRTLALSTLIRFLFRFMAISKAFTATLLISDSL